MVGEYQPDVRFIEMRTQFFVCTRFTEIRLQGMKCIISKVILSDISSVNVTSEMTRICVVRKEKKAKMARMNNVSGHFT